MIILWCGTLLKNIWNLFKSSQFQDFILSRIFSSFWVKLFHATLIYAANLPKQHHFLSLSTLCNSSKNERKIMCRSCQHFLETNMVTNSCPTIGANLISEKYLD